MADFDGKKATQMSIALALKIIFASVVIAALLVAAMVLSVVFVAAWQERSGK